MTKVALETVGCRLNQYETEQLAERLISMGLERVDYSDHADIYILNSCTVTGRADADCRKLIRRVYRKNPEGLIVVAGCYAEADKEKVKSQEGVDLVVGNNEKVRLPEILADRFPELFNHSGTQKTKSDKISLPAVDPGNGNGSQSPRHRPMVKIGDGCDQGCTYCIVPRVRGDLVSYSPDQIISEVSNLVSKGYSEVVLTAVHIGKYNYDGLDLGGLAQEILDKTDLPRLRFSSLEPNELTDQILTLVSENNRVCRHLHLPLQSGSDRILKLMKRPYGRNDYKELIKSVKAANPNITIGCDLIVGFPGEREDDFMASIDILGCGAMDYGHIFSYSDRPGTASLKFQDKVKSLTIKIRNARARRLCEIGWNKHLKRQMNEILEVIPEATPDREGRFWGVSDNYIKVRFPAGFKGGTKIIKFRPTDRGEDFLDGELA